MSADFAALRSCKERPSPVAGSLQDCRAAPIHLKYPPACRYY